MSVATLTKRVRELEQENTLLLAKLDNRKKLSERDVALMRKMYKSGTSQAELADVFDVNSATVSRTVRYIYN